jgi:hypothetical protein
MGAMRNLRCREYAVGSRPGECVFQYGSIASFLASRLRGSEICEEQISLFLPKS